MKINDDSNNIMSSPVLKLFSLGDPAIILLPRLWPSYQDSNVLHQKLIHVKYSMVVLPCNIIGNLQLISSSCLQWSIPLSFCLIRYQRDGSMDERSWDACPLSVCPCLGPLCLDHLKWYSSSMGSGYIHQEKETQCQRWCQHCQSN